MGKIVWIASYPKSGNTWMRFFLYAYLSLEQRDIDRIEVNDPAFTRMFTQDSHRAWFEHRFDKPWEEVTERDVAAARPDAQAEIAAGREGLVLTKTHNALVNEYGHPAINSAVTAGAIYIVRNPLDLVASVQNHYNLKNTARAINFINNPKQISKRSAMTANAPICSWRINVDSWTALPRTGIHVVRYEDMLADPGSTFTSVIRHIGQTPDETRLRRAIDLVRFDRLAESERRVAFPEKPEGSGAFFRSGGAGEWRGSLTKWQIDQIVRANAPTMKRFGYLPGGAD